MIKWLQTYSGTGTNDYNSNQELEELKFLRKELKRYKKKYGDLNNTINKNPSDSEDEIDEEDENFEKELIAKKLKASQMKQRSSVSAEAFGEYNKKKDFKKVVYPKNSSQRERIQTTMEKSILFSQLDDSEKDTVLNAFQEMKFTIDQQIIKQGDEGDVLYLIESGYYECFKQFVTHH